MKFTRFIALICFAVAALACDPKEKTQPDPEAEKPKTEETKKEAVAGPIASLPVKGKKFDPAIKPEQLPEGAFYCDMGTVHWAASENPSNSKCPVCGMSLKQYSAKKVEEQKKDAVEAKEEPHDHDHKDGEKHDHGEGEDHAH